MVYNNPEIKIDTLTLLCCTLDKMNRVPCNETGTHLVDQGGTINQWIEISVMKSHDHVIK